MSGSEVDSLLLIGAGSIGTSHLLAACTRYPSFIVVEPNEEVRRRVEDLLPGKVTTFESLSEANERVSRSASRITAIVATWGPEHANYFSDLVELGIRRILVEKPMANSALRAHQMAESAKLNDVRLVVGNSRRYNGFVEFIKKQFEDVGETPVSCVVHGGALCTVTNGMHWLDLACAVFGDLPISVTADLQDSKINPRSKELGYWEGVVSWAFPHGQRLSITYSNSSSIGGSLSFYSRNARLDQDDEGDLWFGQRDSQAVLIDPRVTRYGPVTHRRSPKTFSPANSATTLMLDLLEADERLQPSPKVHAFVLEAMIASLHASTERRTIDLPLSPNDSCYTKEWAAS